jgi:glyoxylate reductase
MAVKRKPRVLVTRKLPESIETRMMELFDTTLNPDDEPMSAAALKRAMAENDVLVPTVTDRITAEIIAAAGPSMKLIASFGTGVDHIDVKAAAEKGVWVTNTPGVLTEDTADVAMGLILDVMRRLSEGEHLVRYGDWKGWAPTALLGRRLAGKRLGIVGLGRIGQALARRARAFGLSIHYHNRRPVHPEIEAELDATYWESLDQMLARMDIVSVNCPATPATFHLLSARRLRLMRPEAMIVNTARGSVIDEAELARMIEKRMIAAAGLDVFEREPEINPILRQAPNVVLLPHIGSATIEGRIEMGERVLINIKTFADGHRPPDRVLPGFLD